MQVDGYHTKCSNNNNEVFASLVDKQHFLVDNNNDDLCLTVRIVKTELLQY